MSVHIASIHSHTIDGYVSIHWLVHWVHSCEVELAQIEPVIIAHIVLLLIVVSSFVHFSDILRLSFVHIGKIHEDVPFALLICKHFQHFVGGFTIQSIAIFAFHHLFTLIVVKTSKMLIIDVLYVYPFNLEITLELECMIFPPEGKSLLMIS